MSCGSGGVGGGVPCFFIFLLGFFRWFVVVVVVVVCGCGRGRGRGRGDGEVAMAAARITS